MVKVTNIFIQTTRNKKQKVLIVSPISSTSVIVSPHVEMRQIFKETILTIQRYLFGILGVMGLTGVVTSQVENLIESVCYSTGISATTYF